MNFNNWMGLKWQSRILNLELTQLEIQALKEQTVYT